MKLSSSDLLDLNLTSSFIELAIATANVWSKEGDSVLQKARGSYAPYKIVNRTGGAIYVWSDSNSSDDSKSSQSTKIEHGSSIEWRFEDWRKMRDVSRHLSVGQLTIANTTYRRERHQARTPLALSSIQSHGNTFEVFLSIEKESSSTV